MSRVTKFSGAALLTLVPLGVLAALAQTAEEVPTELYVRTTPDGAKVLLNGKPVGTSDHLFPVKPGPYKIVVDLEGYEPEQQQITIRDGRIKRIEFTLEKRLDAKPGPGSPPASGVARRVWSEFPGSFMGGPSPDGKLLLYIDWKTGDLAVHEFATGKNRLVTNEGYSKGLAAHSAFSPDGTQVAYGWHNIPEKRWELRLIGIDGTGTRVLVPKVYPKLAGWSPDGKHIWAILEREDKTIQITSISVHDGSLRVLKSFDWSSSDFALTSLSPDGRYIAYSFSVPEQSNNRDVVLLATDGSREVPLVVHPADDFVLGWAADSKRVVFASDRGGNVSLWALALADRSPQGMPELVVVGMGRRFVPLGLTRAGSLYYGLISESTGIFMAEVDLQTGRVLSPAAPVMRRYEGYNSDPVLSPDGGYLACRTWWQPPATYNLLIHSLQTGEFRELTTRSQLHLRGWTGDGRSLFGIGYGKRGRYGILGINAHTGDKQMLQANQPGRVSNPVSPDGKSMYFTRSIKQAVRIVRRDLESGKEEEVFRLSRPGRIHRLTLSPDGRQFAFEDRGILKVLPVGGDQPRELLNVKGAKKAEEENGRRAGISTLAWTPDASQLLFSTNGDDGWSNLQRVATTGGEPQPIDVKARGLSFLSVHPDGRRIFFQATLQPGKSEVWVMENFLPSMDGSK